MKGISLGLVLLVLLSFAACGLAEDRVKIADEMVPQSTSLSMDRDRLAWSDEAKQVVGVYTFCSGETKLFKVPVKPHDLHLDGEQAYFIGEEGVPVSLNLRTGKMAQLDTISVDGMAADDNYIIWYNTDRIIVHDLLQGKRTEYKADRMIRTADISEGTLVYVDGGTDRRNLVYVVNLRNGRQRTYALQNITYLAVDYPSVALTAVNRNQEDVLKILNLETEQLTTVENLQSQTRPNISTDTVIFQSETTGPANILAGRGIFVYEIDLDRIVHLSRDGVHPVISENWAAWLEDGAIWAKKYR